MKIISWNVNGIRACIKKGFWEFFEKENADIINIQENKAQFDDVKDLVIRKQYDLMWAQAEKKGYSGVSSWYLKNIGIKASVGIGQEQFDVEGRTVILEHDKFFLINGYFPNGRSDHSRVKYKLEYSYNIFKLANALQRETGKGIIVCGDINTAHKEIDLARPKQNKNTTGFLPIERKFIDDIEKMGYVDCFRLKNPEKKDEYSWWSYRARARENNVGWRIDYFFVSEDLKDKVFNCYYDNKQLGSDHCPVILEIDI